MKSTLPDFSKKLISVSFGGSDDSQAVEHPQWKRLGDRLFLVGTVPQGCSTRGWLDGIAVAVAWDAVSDYLVFDSADDYRKRMKIYLGRKRKA
jgi:hypothetical protein